MKRFSIIRNYILPFLGRGMGVGSLLVALLASCSHIGEDERLIYVKPAEVARNVLIEDFTGQRCVNCPTATQAIAELQEAYGDADVVAVAIHSGPFSKTVRGVPYPLATEVGEEYYQFWKLDHQPAGMINRRGVSDYTDWGTLVYEERQKTAAVGISTWVEFNADNRRADITVRTNGADGTVEGKLQVWLTEDNITAFQYMPDGSTNQTYLHNHVFRDAVNGAWGTDFSIAEGETKDETFTYTIPGDKDWKPGQMHVVAFVYTDKGVEQVCTVPLVSAPDEE